MSALVSRSKDGGKGAIHPRLTIYPGTGHASWVPAYDDSALYRWLFEQRVQYRPPI
jgi:hypothetical protein